MPFAAPPVRQADDDRWRRPPAFPPAWADAWGDDRFGLWAEFGVDAVVQRLRWVEPGSFRMGSLDTERALFGDKDYEAWARNEAPRHEVRLTAGFWLADSACTQALWLAVMGSNPSHFSGETTLPVEQVSWDEVQGFLQRLQAGLPDGSEPVLPTEAEWEYACRAGTETAFSFGATLSTAQANYDGNYPYGKAPKGPYRERTVPVKSLPANAWGLYQMHGNVWEWCADDLRDYAATALRDAALQDPWGPVPQEQVAHRAVRGGSWFSLAWALRSALRERFLRVDRNLHLGFRVALRS